MPPVDRDAFLHDALRRLAAPHAPRTLLPRVLAAARAWAGRPWYRRAWLTWPVAWQAASVAALVLVVAIGAWLLPEATAFVDRQASRLPLAGLAPLLNTATRVARVVRECAAVGDAIWGLWRTLMLPGVLYGYALLGLTGAAWLAWGATLNRFTFGKALSR